MLLTILTCILLFGFIVLCGATATSMIFSIIEERKQAKRNEAREQREIEQHKARMEELNRIAKK